MEYRYWKFTGYPEDERKKIGRNAPCPCGSGLKFKKCCLINKKPRATSIVADFGKPTEIKEIIYDRLERQVHFISHLGKVEPISVICETNYERTKGEKVINRSSLPPNDIRLEPNLQVELYDKIFAVDTNTRTIGGEVVSVTGVVLCEAEDAVTIDGIYGKYKPVNCVEFRNAQLNPELTGLRIVIKAIMSNPKFANNMRVCIITDHDLNHLVKYNKNEIPLLENFYLPSNFTLIYGSSDVGKNEYLPNILISVAHDSANEMLESIEKHDVYGNSSHIPIERPSYSYFRIWTHKDCLKSE